MKQNNERVGWNSFNQSQIPDKPKEIVNESKNPDSGQRIERKVEQSKVPSNY